MGDPVTMIMIATAVSVGTSIQQAQIAKKQAALQKEQYESNKKIAIKKAEYDTVQAKDRHEFQMGSNLSLATRSGVDTFSSPSFLAHTSYNARVLNDNLAQIDLNKEASITRANLGISQASLGARYAVWGAVSDIGNTFASSSYKLYQLNKDDAPTTDVVN
jgi:hypothetical protein